MFIDGTKIAKATTIDLLLQDDFDLMINERRFAVRPPKTGKLLLLHAGCSPTVTSCWVPPYSYFMLGATLSSHYNNSSKVLRGKSSAA